VRDLPQGNLKGVIVVNRDERMFFPALLDDAQTGRKDVFKITGFILVIISEVWFFYS
jgi:hypothetical protein